VTNEATGPTNQGKSSSHWFCQHFTGSELIVKSPDSEAAGHASLLLAKLPSFG
jgi:hypothetical protein